MHSFRHITCAGRNDSIISMVNKKLSKSFAKKDLGPPKQNFGIGIIEDINDKKL